jgi:hypothetical protein
MKRLKALSLAAAAAAAAAESKKAQWRRHEYGDGGGDSEEALLKSIIFYGSCGGARPMRHSKVTQEALCLPLRQHMMKNLTFNHYICIKEQIEKIKSYSLHISQDPSGA